MLRKANVALNVNIVTYFFHLLLLKFIIIGIDMKNTKTSHGATTFYFDRNYDVRFKIGRGKYTSNKSMDSAFGSSLLSK